MRHHLTCDGSSNRVHPDFKKSIDTPGDTVVDHLNTQLPTPGQTPDLTPDLITNVDSLDAH